ncbi:AlkZ family DNA glycosylase [Catenulispora sp. NL8]|uniref:AlkZ family DNA glycosylase n=1 Tax=Catenulispora pinistramenti TaxID=2705254 RepID=A0ABS5KZ42_9ACTN|nr:winged helix DNA-binding domain-containing protein [Catenulispora pinistramenti]MBS2551318.1 AlkZ family DNA glycosylase [Catenulispora pinistramenti]
MTVRTLSDRDLNRALLDRQLLLRRSPMDAAEAVEHLVGLQTQIPPNHYVALWSRLEAFDAQRFSQRFEDREFVRISLQRSTIHTVTARDCRPLRQLLQPVQDRNLKGAFGKRLQGVDLKELAERARVLAEEEPRTFNELGVLLAESYPGHDVQALGVAARNNLALVQVTPRGLWLQGGLPKHTTAEHWLGNAKAVPAMEAEELVLRYLKAFGPASVMDAQNWSGLTRLREVFEKLRPNLVLFQSESGTELFDLPDAPRPGEDVPVPARFLPDYDNVFIGHKDRARINDARIPKEKVFAGNTPISPFTVDGFIRGSWKVETDKKRTTATLNLTPMVPTTKTQRADLAAEGARLLEFLAPGADHDLRWLEDTNG